MLASAWGHINYGFREIHRSNEESEVEAFAWDLETNTRASRLFTVAHIRDRKEGAVQLTDQRDKYEIVANLAQRRVRECIFQIIPDDVKEMALDDCRKTIERGDGLPLEERIARMEARFKEVGVTREMLEQYLKHPLDKTAAP